MQKAVSDATRRQVRATFQRSNIVRELMKRATQALIGTSAGIRLIGAAVVAVLLIGPATALAQQPATRTEEVSAAFTIEAIDHTSRIVTLRNKAGLLEEVYCGPEVQRFDQLKVGDVVTFRYYETVVTALSRPGAAAAAPSTTVTRTPGAPGGTIARQTTATVTLDAIDPKTPSVTVRTASRRPLDVQGPGRQEPRGLQGRRPGEHHLHPRPGGQRDPAGPAGGGRTQGADGGLRVRDARHGLQLQVRSTRTGSTPCGSTGCRRSTASSARTAARLPVSGRPAWAFEASTRPPLGELRTTFEFEMFGTGVDEGQTTFRLRHAYGELGAFGAGQYLEPVHGHRRVPELARVPGDPPAWCSSATSRRAGCRSRAPAG